MLLFTLLTWILEASRYPSRCTTLAASVVVYLAATGRATRGGSDQSLRSAKGAGLVKKYAVYLPGEHQDLACIAARRRVAREGGYLLTNRNIK